MVVSFPCSPNEPNPRATGSTSPPGATDGLFTSARKPGTLVGKPPAPPGRGICLRRLRLGRGARRTRWQAVRAASSREGPSPEERLPVLPAQNSGGWAGTQCSTRGSHGASQKTGVCRQTPAARRGPSPNEPSGKLCGARRHDGRVPNEPNGKLCGAHATTAVHERTQWQAVAAHAPGRPCRTNPVASCAGARRHDGRHQTNPMASCAGSPRHDGRAERTRGKLCARTPRGPSPNEPNGKLCGHAPRGPSPNEPNGKLCGRARPRRPCTERTQWQAVARATPRRPCPERTQWQAVPAAHATRPVTKRTRWQAVRAASRRGLSPRNRPEIMRLLAEHHRATAIPRSHGPPLCIAHKSRRSGTFRGGRDNLLSRRRSRKKSSARGFRRLLSLRNPGPQVVRATRSKPSQNWHLGLVGNA